MRHRAGVRRRRGGRPRCAWSDRRASRGRRKHGCRQRRAHAARRRRPGRLAQARPKLKRKHKLKLKSKTKGQAHHHIEEGDDGRVQSDRPAQRRRRSE